MKPTLEHHNDFLAHKPIKGVNFEHNDSVLIISGEYKDKKGSLVSILEIGVDPIFILELDSGLGVNVQQSVIGRINL